MHKELSAISDVDLIERMCEGDHGAVGVLYDRYSKFMINVSLRWFGNKASAEDLVHDVFLEVWGKAKSYDPKRSSVKSWLMMRLRSRAMDRFRSLGRFKEEDLGEILGSAEAYSIGFDENIDIGILRSHFPVLSIEQIEVMESIYFYGESGQEAADRLGIPIGTLKSRLAAGIKRLREEVQREKQPK